MRLPTREWSETSVYRTLTRASQWMWGVLVVGILIGFPLVELAWVAVVMMLPVGAVALVLIAGRMLGPATPIALQLMVIPLALARLGYVIGLLYGFVMAIWLITSAFPKLDIDVAIINSFLLLGCPVIVAVSYSLDRWVGRACVREQLAREGEVR